MEQQGTRGILVQVGKDSFRLDTSDPTLYNRHLAGVCGVEAHVLRGEVVDVLIHRTHLPLLPIVPKITPHRSSDWPVSPPSPLRDYQADAVRFARERGGAAFFHDLGLGKNYMVFPALDYPALAVCPTSAIQVWLQEAESYGLEVQVHHGLSSDPSAVSADADLHLVTYGSASSWLPLFHGRGRYPRVRSVVLDEAHVLHKRASRIHRALAGVRRDCTIVMTATPARNRLRSLHGLLHALAPGAFGTLIEFRHRYCGATLDAYGHMSDSDDLTNTDELASRLSEIAITETWISSRVAHLRPPLHREAIPVDLGYGERVDLMDASIHRAFDGLRTAGFASASQISYMTAQRVELGKLKANWLCNQGLLEDLLERHRRLLIWCWHKEVLRPLQLHLQVNADRPVDVVSGEAPSGKRTRIIQEWQHGDPTSPRILLATLGAMSTAVNLTTAEAACFVEVSWAPLDLQQAEARHHRPGSRFDKVYAYYLTAPGLIDDRIAKVLVDKVSHIEAALGQCSQKEQMLMLLRENEDVPWIG